MFSFLKRIFAGNQTQTPKTNKQTPLHSSAVAAAQKSVPSAAKLHSSPLSSDYAALAASFNDFLLDSGTSSTAPLNEVEHFIRENLEKMLQGDIPESAVPRLPDVGMALLKQLGNTEITTTEIMSYISRDPALASEVLHMANSAMFRPTGCETIANLENAVVILGLENLKMVVSSALMKRMLVIAPVYFKMFGRHLWEHSLNCAHACRALAEIYQRGDANNAYLVGLMHDVGKLAIFGLLSKALGQYLDYTPRGGVFSGIVRDHSAALSAKIAQKWDLPDYLKTALAEQVNGPSIHDYSNYGFILNQANILAEFKAIAEITHNRNKDLEELALEYGIPLALYTQVFSMR
ncbi:MULTISPECIES: HDOD domain-containing protein [Methylomonas]|uniref:HDOD domain-containing protein n=2 Tax=Methylomonas TaxID=416 RepID=A0A126T8F5_9GAMM|nr:MULTISPECIES: HDOD domain-containing protein [Methylomonas]AMK78054.1 hypothetical protein JT25_016470 [Methylomonas denitrificans]OAI07649.1 hypothetical protein A1342_10170 [Methylomonas methanica]TCV85589.1 HD-like signal output (HDOD) protein [Methylomonas methanica]